MSVKNSSLSVASSVSLKIIIVSIWSIIIILHDLLIADSVWISGLFVKLTIENRKVKQLDIHTGTCTDV